MAGCRVAGGVPCPHEHPPGGTRHWYANHGCRCSDCRAASSEYRRSRKPEVRCRDTGKPCPHDVIHGALTTYSNHGCRCQPCRDGWARYIRELKVRKRLRVRRILREGGRDPRPHGTYSGYTNWGCRCRECRLANSRRSVRRNAKRRADRLEQHRE